MAYSTRIDCAWVNKSNSTINVYSGLVSSSIHIGGLTVGGTVIGVIYSNEFYIGIGRDDNCTFSEIIFQNPNGKKTYGYIETSPGTGLGLYSWVSSQEPYHYYNSDGSTLVSSSSEVINGTSYKIFTVNDTVPVKDSAGNSRYNLLQGTKIATTGTTVGATYKDHMVFTYQKYDAGWVTFFPQETNKYAFVDLKIATGTFPNNRVIR